MRCDVYGPLLSDVRVPRRGRDLRRVTQPGARPSAAPRCDGTGYGGGCRVPFERGRGTARAMACPGRDCRVSRRMMVKETGSRMKADGCAYGGVAAPCSHCVRATIEDPTRCSLAKVLA